ncbi:MAG: Molybdenum-pterin-binding protein 2 [Gammaproteobacteria bacterium]|nr:Molybdenum-pterin-binding protein 2 [Gammaproteobacteria bacterium]
MRYGARNQLIGKVRGIKKGKLMSQVDVMLDAGGLASSVMTIDSLKDLKLKKGDSVRVVVKAVNVLLVKEG